MWAMSASHEFDTPARNAAAAEGDLGNTPTAQRVSGCVELTSPEAQSVEVPAAACGLCKPVGVCGGDGGVLVDADSESPSELFSKPLRGSLPGTKESPFCAAFLRHSAPAVVDALLPGVWPTASEPTDDCLRPGFPSPPAMPTLDFLRPPLVADAPELTFDGLREDL